MHIVNMARTDKCGTIGKCEINRLLIVDDLVSTNIWPSARLKCSLAATVLLLDSKLALQNRGNPLSILQKSF